ncbi:hypothetical protein TeGR_g12259 [Tetraparma gracilis]|uniref:Macro domain-containing protein n=1 Tax=Tetraparma gracilis TaxID=2962635 RepID=A0ABQ6NCR4_9STRA|nr:hypothetical protein TeGR_g12259 [Tetraparma gracilis]
MSLLLRRSFPRSTLSLHLSPCAVTSPPPPAPSAPLPSLIVPTNSSLTSTSLFPYFPVGGRPPPGNRLSKNHWAPPGHVSSWGGMEAGPGMLYSAATVDGLVYLSAGASYAASLASLRASLSPPPPLARLRSLLGAAPPPEPLPAGGPAAVLPASGALAPLFAELIHVAVPFPDEPGARRLLGRAWDAALEAAGEGGVVAPLLGAGCRGFGVGEAAGAARDAAGRCGGGEVRVVVREGGVGEEVKRVFLEGAG